MGGKPRRGALLEAVRRQIAEMVAGVEERVDPDTGAIELSRRGHFATLEQGERQVRLTLVHGAALPDFTGLLEGEGPGARVLPIRSTRQLASTAVKTLLSMALFDDETHDFRDRAARPRRRR